MKIDLAALTDDQPFCAGVVLVRDGRLVVTLNDDHLPTEVSHPALRVGGVGGGQEPRENIWECALREAHEELGVAVDLVPSPVTYFHDWETQELVEVERVEDELAPLLVERWERPSPDVPFAPGLPTGPYLYCATFLAVAGAAAEVRPCDVLALLLVEPTVWPFLEETPTLGAAGAAGAELVASVPISEDAVLWMHPHESLRIAVPLLEQVSVRAALGV
jgi:8-oxo-dGTP pyrophosphatase MutT (NUDIX family)